MGDYVQQARRKRLFVPRTLFCLRRAFPFASDDAHMFGRLLIPWDILHIFLYGTMAPLRDPLSIYLVLTLGAVFNLIVDCMIIRYSSLGIINEKLRDEYRYSRDERGTSGFDRDAKVGFLLTYRCGFFFLACFVTVS